MVQKALGILIVGIIVSIGGMIFMAINISANVTGWGTNTTSFYRVIVPLVIFAGWILIIIAGAFISQHRGDGV
jgi:hypothetical protein